LASRDEACRPFLVRDELDPVASGKVRSPDAGKHGRVRAGGTDDEHRSDR
jgi:hypothetical protein